MKQSILISELILFTCLLIFPQAAMSEVKIFLKNGMDIIADSCRDTKGKLICEKLGGTFEIDQKDILDVKGITIERAPAKEVPEEKTGKESEAAVKPEAEPTSKEKQPPGGQIKGLSPEDEKRLNQINQKKTEYQAERQRLIDERQQLHEDIKNTGMIKTQQQFDAIKKRISDLETRINSFNEDVRNLNAEQQKIVEGSKNRQ